MIQWFQGNQMSWTLLIIVNFIMLKEAWNCWMTSPETLPWVCNICHNFYQHALHSLLFLLRTSLQIPEQVFWEGQDAGGNYSGLYWCRWNELSSPNLFPSWNILKGHIYTKKRIKHEITADSARCGTLCVRLQTETKWESVFPPPVAI